MHAFHTHSHKVPEMHIECIVEGMAICFIIMSGYIICGPLSFSVAGTVALYNVCTFGLCHLLNEYLE